MKTLKYIIIIIIIAVIGWFVWSKVKPTSGPVSVAGWQTTTDGVTGLSFQYPKDLGTTYIRPTDWPPAISASTTTFSCTPGGSPTAQLPGGLTEQRVINGRTYCVTRESEGAAGSIYNLYAYAFARNNGTTILAFTLQYPQCPNYEEPQKTACTEEQQAFNVDNLVDRIAQTIK